MELWIIYALLSAIFAALVAIFGKIGLQNIDSTLATTIRSVVMAIFLVVVSLSLGKFDLINTIKSKALLFIVLSGIAGAMSWLFYFFAIKTGIVSRVAVLDKLSVVFVIVFTILFLGEKLSWSTTVGTVLIASGAIIMTIYK